MIPKWSPIVAIDIRTTGPDFEFDSIYQLGAVQLNSEFKPVIDVPKLKISITATITPQVKRQCSDLADYALSAISLEDACRIWRNWCPLDHMIPVCFQWHLIWPFLSRDFPNFTVPARDLQTYLTFMHDRHWWSNYNPGFTSFTPRRLFEICQVEVLDPKDPLHTCLGYAECIRYLLQHPLP